MHKLMILTIITFSINTNAHRIRVDYPDLYKAYNEIFDEMVFSKAFEAEYKYNTEKADNIRDRIKGKTRVVVRTGVNRNVENSSNEYVYDGQIIEGGNGENNHLTQYALRFNYELYDGDVYKNEEGLYRAKGKANKFRTMSHKRDRVRVYLRKLIEYFKLSDMIESYEKDRAILAKIEKRYKALFNNKIASVFEFDLVKSRNSLYGQRYLKARYQREKALGFFSPSMQKYIQLNKERIKKDLLELMKHHSRYELNTCSTYDLDKKYMQIMNESYQYEAAFKKSINKPRLEIISELRRNHNSLEDNQRTDAYVGLELRIPLFHSNENNYYDKEVHLRANRIQKTINFKKEKNNEFERGFRREVSKRLILINEFKKTLKEVNSNRFYDYRLLKQGIIKLETFFSLLDVKTSTKTAYQEEKWKHIETMFFQTVLCNYHDIKGV